MHTEVEGESGILGDTSPLDGVPRLGDGGLVEVQSLDECQDLGVHLLVLLVRSAHVSSRTLCSASTLCSENGQRDLDIFP